MSTLIWDSIRAGAKYRPYVKLGELGAKTHLGPIRQLEAHFDPFTDKCQSIRCIYK